MTLNARASHVVRASAVMDKAEELSTMRQARSYLSVHSLRGVTSGLTTFLPPQVIEHLLARKNLSVKQAEHALEVLTQLPGLIPRPPPVPDPRPAPAATAQGCRPCADGRFPGAA